jgi:predicted outer membrane repeat protein
VNCLKLGAQSLNSSSCTVVVTVTEENFAGVRYALLVSEVSTWLAGTKQQLQNVLVLCLLLCPPYQQVPCPASMHADIDVVLQISLTHCSVEGNTALTLGGGIFMDDGSQVSTKIDASLAAETVCYLIQHLAHTKDGIEHRYCTC